MKTLLLIIACAALSGCTTIAKLDSQIPDGNWRKAHAKVVGEVIRAEINGSGKKVDGKWVKGSVTATYNGYFVKELVVELEAEGDK